MIIPQAHLNGTSKRELVDQLLSARNALDVAAEALREAFPNGRDYYHTGNYPEARAEWTEKLNAVSALADEMYAAAIEIGDQEGGR